MPVKELRNRVDDDWGVTWTMSKEHWKSDDQGIHCTFPKDEFASEAGVNFRCTPKEIFPSDDVTMQYKVFVPETFEWVKGGKMPGLYIGKPGSGGGDWNQEGASSRLMWREGGRVVSYIYCCTDLGKYNGTADSPLVREQGKGFDAISHHTGGAGIDLWRDEVKPLQLVRGQWNDIALRVKLNSSGTQADGIIAVNVNGVSKEFDGMAWTKAPDTKKIEGMLFSTWYGGGSKEYAPRKENTLSFKDFVLKSAGSKSPESLTRRIVTAVKQLQRTLSSDKLSKK